MKVFELFFESFKLFPRLFILNIILLFTMGGFETLSIFSLGSVIEIFKDPELQNVSKATLKAASFLQFLGIPAKLTPFVIVFILFNVFKQLSILASNYISFKLNFRLGEHLIGKSFTDYYNSSWKFFTSHKQGELINTFGLELEQIIGAVGCIYRYIRNIANAVFLTIVLFSISWEISLIAIFLGGVAYLPSVLLERISFSFSFQKTKHSNMVQVLIQETFDAAKIIIGYAKQSFIINRLRNNYRELSNAKLKGLMINHSVSAYFEPMSLAFLFLILYISTEHLGKTITQATTILYTLKLLLPCVMGLAHNRNQIKSHGASYEQYRSLLEDARKNKFPSGDNIFNGFSEKIAFKNVSFSYHENKNVLNSLSLDFPKNKMTALVGQSGSGKSTLIDLLMGFYKIDSGSFLIDDQSFYDYELKSYRNQIGYVPQDCFLFNATVKENLSWWSDQYSDDEIIQACKMAHCHEFVLELENGYDTIVGDKGTRLSGGQKQRLAFARALLAKPSILILDEATSALDTESERLIQKAVDELSGQITIIAIAHRLSTIMNADIIYVLKNGELIESGNYSSLIDNKNYFNDLVEAQKLDA